MESLIDPLKEPCKRPKGSRAMALLVPWILVVSLLAPGAAVGGLGAAQAECKV